MLPGKSIQTLYTTGWPLVYIYFKGFNDSPSFWLVPSTDWSCGFTYRKQQYIAGKIGTTLTLSPTSCPAWQYCLSWPYLWGSKCFVAIAENYSGHIVLFGGGKAGFVDYLGKYVLGPRRLNTLFVTCPYYSYLHLSPTYMAIEQSYFVRLRKIKLTNLYYRTIPKIWYQIPFNLLYDRLNCSSIITSHSLDLDSLLVLLLIMLLVPGILSTSPTLP
jgi:hypothetical protein